MRIYAMKIGRNLAAKNIDVNITVPERLLMRSTGTCVRVILKGLNLKRQRTIIAIEKVIMRQHSDKSTGLTFISFVNILARLW